ncbi:MAG: hypothetical protein JW734_02750 [Candidatus Omnitrophica bacterium]|nr:hypothetical protein [Candidatus Omnitrophota bacterium]
MKINFLKYIFIDPAIRFRLIAIIVIIIALFYIHGQSKIQIKNLSRLRNELTEAEKLISRTPEMNKLIEDFMMQPKKIKFVLRGVFLSDATPKALIGTQYYEAGDSVNDHIIKKINLNSVILEDKETGFKQELFVTDLLEEFITPLNQTRPDDPAENQKQ